MGVSAQQERRANAHKPGENLFDGRDVSSVRVYIFKQVSRFDPETALSQVENPELRRIIEQMYRRR